MLIGGPLGPPIFHAKKTHEMFFSISCTRYALGRVLLMNESIMRIIKMPIAVEEWRNIQRPANRNRNTKYAPENKPAMNGPISENKMIK